ncbi:hypothetical protein B5F10_03950 [Anaerotruncus colihominis]|uniref:Type I restriction modification DNA specificity domain-containing protein n=1 Tax=Anaerotruncus colihominis TaxID=169435 RepID=A0A1Y4MUZ9_9FIRM|nr:restriction endonuclease subunit S [Anaerotruncus colihominis]OUP71471.1 hypothetical protein B5F11_00925 [Anaerotruncus colihominis]OUP75400.1 hypothetical protein B5F10_03950 [Anaerotruncus colihominis]
MTPANGFAEMKDSGILGCGSIPSHWETIALKYVALLDGKVDTSNITPEDTVSFVPMECIRNDKRIPKTAQKSKDNGTYSSFCNGDIAIAKVTPCFENGNICVMASLENGYAFGSSELFSVRPQNIVGRYLFYSLQTPYFLDGGAATMTGVGGLKRVSSYYMKNVKIVFPPLSEQSTIASYLDAQCAKIDEIIAQDKASIEDYKQWKMSVVNDAVTHGLDPNAEMKDSGIYWMGKIPTKWGLKRLKYIFAIKKDIAGELGHTVLAITQQGIKPKNMSDKGQFALDYSKYQLVVPGDFAMNHMDLLTGWVDISQYSGVTSPDYRVFFALHPEEIDTNYYKHVFQTCYRCRIFYGLGQGVSGLGRWRLPAEMFLNFVLPVPPLDEQRKIGEFLDKQCAKIDDLIIEKQSLIDDLESYKKSFIYEVVTGKRRIAEPDQMTIAVLSPDILRYQKALLMLRILDLLGNKARGRIHLQKCMFAAECLLNIPFQTQYIRYDHGPYDLHLADYETVLCDSGWFNIQKGSHVTYQKSRHFAEGLKEYMNVFSDIDEKLKHIVAFLKPMKTTQAERVATLLAAWNDFIIDGISHPTDKEIINEVMSNWTPNKANPQYSTWQDTLTKIRKNRFIPSGFGIHTLKKEVLLQEE